MKSYFDGGNQADSTQYNVLSLAVLSGTEAQWPAFERDWKKNLAKHRFAYLHTTDAVSEQGIYDGVKTEKIDAFLRDCVTITRRHMALPRKGDFPGKFGLFPYIVTVNLKDFVQAELHPDMNRNANELCIRQALHSCLLWGQQQGACKDYAMFFDQGEPFYGYLVNLLQSKQAKTDARLLNHVVQRSEVDMRRVPAMQLADLYAWCISHSEIENKRKWHERLWAKFPWSGEYHTAESMTIDNAVDPQIWKSWKIPKRKPTR